jgi:hypothetical protein
MAFSIDRQVLTDYSYLELTFIKQNNSYDLNSFKLKVLKTDFGLFGQPQFLPVLCCPARVQGARYRVNDARFEHPLSCTVHLFTVHPDWKRELPERQTVLSDGFQEFD